MKKIEKVNVNNGITDICNSAFSDITNVTEIVFPDSIVDFGDYVCADCPSLKKVTLPKGITNIPDGMFSDDTSLESIGIPESVTCIKLAAFDGCSKLANIVLPENIAAIEYAAFKDTGLKEITIPKSVNELSCAAFDNCQNLKAFKVESGNEKYYVKNGILYENDYSVTLLSYPAGRSDSSFEIPSDVEMVAADFSFASSLKEITFGTNISYIYGAIGGKQTMLVYDGSYALEYAKKNGLKYRVIPKPTPAVIEIVAPSKTMYTYHVGDFEKQQLTVRFADGRDEKVNVTDWESSNTSVALVWHGEVTAYSKGKTTITATAEDGRGNTVKAEIKITVKKNNKKVSKVTVDKKMLTLTVGEKYTPVVTIKPATAYANQLKWKSSNKKVAKVSKDGVITAVKKGTAKITVTAESGKKAVVTIKVKK